MTAASEMRACEEALLHTDFSGNPAQLQKFIAEDFTEVSSNGVASSRQSVIDWLLRKDVAARWLLRDLSVAEIAPGLRLVRYHAQQLAPVVSTSKGALHCSLWSYHPDLQCWQLRFHQATKIL